MKFRTFFVGLLLATVGFCPLLRAEDGYRLWLRYEPISDAATNARYTAALGQVVFVTLSGLDSPTLAAAREELHLGLTGLLGHDVPVKLEKSAQPLPFLGDGYMLASTKQGKTGEITISAEHDLGVLYGSFDLLRRIQTRQPIDPLAITSIPKINHRLLNHWDNLNGTVARGYAGSSLWEWFILPDYLSPRYRDYARACASIGINGAVLTNVNANAQFLTAP